MQARKSPLARTLLSGLLLAVLAGSSSVAGAEERIAFANMQLVLSLMPEMKSVMGRLESFEKELTKQLDVKRAYAQQKLVEAQEAAANGASDEDLDRYRRQLQDLDQEIRRQESDSGDRMAAKQAELVEPVVAKLQETVEAVAKREGYTFVINAVDGVGTSTVLYGPDDRNITRAILDELGIEPPEEEIEDTTVDMKDEVPAPAPPKTGGTGATE
jgi:outer membrane protein